MRPRAMSPMRAGDVVRCDFGTPARGEPGFVRPAIVVTSDDVLEFRQHAITVVPCTTTRRGWLSEVDIAGFGVAQAHLPTDRQRRPRHRGDGHEHRARRAATDSRTSRRPARTLRWSPCGARPQDPRDSGTHNLTGIVTI